MTKSFCYKFFFYACELLKFPEHDLESERARAVHASLLTEHVITGGGTRGLG